MSLSTKQNNLLYIEEKLAQLKQCFSGFDLLSISSWSELVVWQAANGISKQQPCLFQMFLVASLFNNKVKEMLVDTMKNTQLLDEELKDNAIQKFICFTLRNSAKHNMQALYNVWIDVVRLFNCNTELILVNDYNTKAALQFLFKTMDIIESKSPFTFLKVFLENPIAYYSDNEFYAYVHIRLKNAAKKHQTKAMLNILKAFEQKVAYLANTTAFMN